MMKELKVKIQDLKQLEATLENIQAKLIEELNVVDTYFKQPEGHVLKIVEDNEGNYISELKSENGIFKIVRKDKIENVEEEKIHLEKEHGIHRILKKKRKIYSYREFKIDLNLIEKVGDFLILLGEKPSESIIENELGLVNPEYIRVPFSEL